jgi:FHA domain-containing protein
VSEQPAPDDLRPRTPDEVTRLATAERYGDPFVVLRDPDGELRLLSLPGSWDVVNIGRSPSAELSLPWDRAVSAVHAQLERVADDWVLVDDGLSRNGSFINGDRLAGRRRLFDSDRLRFGSTEVLFRHPLQKHQGTLISDELP